MASPQNYNFFTQTAEERAAFLAKFEAKFCAERGITSFIEYSQLSDDERTRRDAIAHQRAMQEIESRARLRPQVARTLPSKKHTASSSGKRDIGYRLRYLVLKRDHYRCCICGRTGSDGIELEVDHKIPHSKGGKTHIENLWTLCLPCNRGKSDLE